MKLTFIVLIFFNVSAASFGQEIRCDPQTIRNAVGRHDIENKTSVDVFFFTGAYYHPIEGRDQLVEARKKLATERKNQSKLETHAKRIVVSKSGDMAYEYGSVDQNWDEVKTGEHVMLHTHYLRVWKLVGGQCLIAAFMTHQ